MNDSTPYYFLIGLKGLRSDGKLSSNPGEWQTFYAKDVDAHLVHGTRPGGMKSGDFHARGSYRFNLAAGNKGAALQ